MPPRLRIAQVAPPLEPVPPRAYGGTERVVERLVVELHRRGHEVTTFASGDSVVPGRLIPTVERALWPAGHRGDYGPQLVATITRLLDHAHEFDLVHSHLEWYNPLVARLVDVPVVATFHGRLDLPFAGPLLAGTRCLPVGISRSQVAALPGVPWAAVVHNGLALDEMPFGRQRSDALCFVGRVAPEKGVADAIRVALAAGRRIRIAAKVGGHPADLEYYESIFLPAVRRAGRLVEYLGELGRADRDRLFAESHATLMTGDWPEPFGLVAIESLACGTPVVALRRGALPEIVRDRVDGVLGDSVDELAARMDEVASIDRARIRRDVIRRFSASRMVDEYEALYLRALECRAERPVTTTVAAADRPARIGTSTPWVLRRRGANGSGPLMPLAGAGADGPSGSPATD